MELKTEATQENFQLKERTPHKFKERLEATGFSQEELAFQLGRGRTQISLILSGYREADPELEKRMHRVILAFEREAGLR